MPIRVVKVFVAICPKCGNRISATGECEWDVWPTREDLHEALEEGGDPSDRTWDAKIAAACGCWRKETPCPARQPAPTAPPPS